MGRVWDESSIRWYLHDLDPDRCLAWLGPAGGKAVAISSIFLRGLRGPAGPLRTGYWANLFVAPDHRDLMLYPRLLRAMLAEARPRGPRPHLRRRAALACRRRAPAGRVLEDRDVPGAGQAAAAVPGARDLPALGAGARRGAAPRLAVRRLPGRATRETRRRRRTRARGSKEWPRARPPPGPVGGGA